MKKKVGIMLNSLKAFFWAVFVRREKWDEMVIDNYFPVYVNKKGEVLYCKPEWIEELYEEMVD